METLFIYIACLTSQDAERVRYSHLQLPAHGTIHKKTLHGFFGERADDYGLDAIPIESPPKVRAKVYDFPRGVMGPPGNNFRHQIRFDNIWIAINHTSLYQWRFVDLHLYNSKSAKQFSEKYPDSIFPDRLPRYTLFDKYDKIRLKQFESGLGPFFATNVLGFGSVPTSGSSVKSYILPKETKEFEIWDSNFRWDEKNKEWKIKLSARFEMIDKWTAELDSNDFKRRSKAFEELEKVGYLARDGVEKLLSGKPSAEGRRRAEILLEKILANKSKWDELFEDAENYEKFPSLFAEDFYFFLRNKEYFYVTQSGKLFHAPPQKKGEKSRTMKSLWQGDKFPIVAVIEDADHDRVWLFTKAKKKDETQAVFFEMAAEIRTQPFDHAKLAPVNVESRARPLLEYLPLIREKAKKQPKQ